ncbi:MAG: hypothetical protein EXR71_01185 [Myxococcales bacterium]|nr:hypothetical protein [Myxococcales bacterium]
MNGAARRARRAVGLLAGSAFGLGRGRPAGTAALRIPAAAWAVGLGFGCEPATIEPLPATAVATAVTIEAVGADGAAYRVSLAGASTDRAGGAPIDATTTEVARIGGGADLHIDAPRSSWDLKKHVARFDGGVLVTRGPVVLRCDRLDVTYADGGTLDMVVATGNIKVEHGVRRAAADRAELIGKTGRITLTGNPRLSEDASTLVGERIVLWLDDDKADCEGTAGSPCRLVVAGTALGG